MNLLSFQIDSYKYFYTVSDITIGKSNANIRIKLVFMRVFSQVVRKTFLPYDKRCKKETYLHIACVFLQLGSVSSTNALIKKILQDIPPFVCFMNCL